VNVVVRSILLYNTYEQLFSSASDRKRRKKTKLNYIRKKLNYIHQFFKSYVLINPSTVLYESGRTGFQLDIFRHFDGLELHVLAVLFVVAGISLVEYRLALNPAAVLCQTSVQLGDTLTMTSPFTLNCAYYSAVQPLCR